MKQFQPVRRAMWGLGALLLLQARCNDPQQYIPYVPVDFSVNVNLPAYMDLSVPSGHVLVSGGSQGIILYRYTLDQFVALDRHATFDIPANCQVEVAEDGLLITDPCSNSEWLILDGSVVSGDAVYPLHRYATQWNDPVLSVFNP